jgi:hypothetical protein
MKPMKPEQLARLFASEHPKAAAFIAGGGLEDPKPVARPGRSAVQAFESKVSEIKAMLKGPIAGLEAINRAAVKFPDLYAAYLAAGQPNR